MFDPSFPVRVFVIVFSMVPSLDPLALEKNPINLRPNKLLILFRETDSAEKFSIFIFFSLIGLQTTFCQMSVLPPQEVDIRAGDILLYNWGGPKLKGPWRHAEIALSDAKPMSISTGACFGDGCFLVKRNIRQYTAKKPHTVRVIRFHDPEIAGHAADFACELLSKQHEYTNLAKMCLIVAKKCFVGKVEAKGPWTATKIERILKGVDHTNMYCSELVALVWMLTLSKFAPVAVKDAFPVKNVGGCKPFNLDELISPRFAIYWKFVGDYTNIIAQSSSQISAFFACRSKPKRGGRRRRSSSRRRRRRSSRRRPRRSRKRRF